MQRGVGVQFVTIPVCLAGVPERAHLEPQEAILGQQRERLQLASDRRGGASRQE